MYPWVGWAGKNENKTTAEEVSEERKNISGSFQIAVR
jgi:hypothetical protein